MITTTYNYSSGSGFVYDSTKITFIGGMAQLLLNNAPGQTYVPDLSTSSFDHSLMQYSSGNLEQLDQRPATATFYAALSTVIDATWSSGVGTGTSINGGAIVAGKLTGDSQTPKGASWSSINNISNIQVGCRRFTWIPQYTGTPAGAGIAALYNEGGSDPLANLLGIYANGSTLNAVIYDNGGGVITTLTGSLSPVSGTSYEVEFDFDITSGNQYLFVNGVLIASDTATGTRNLGSLTTIWHGQNGSGATLGGQSDYSNLIIYNSIQHRTNYTPFQPITQTIYTTATAILPEFSYSDLGSVQLFSAFATTDFGMPVYTLNGLYWNGSSWVTSNGTYGQANSAAIVNTNIAALSPSNTLQINMIVQPSNTQAGISHLLLTYTSQIYPVSAPSIAPAAPLTLDSMSNFVATLTHPGSTLVKFFFKIGGINYWWSGSAWAVSDGSEAESNLSSEIVANLSTLPVTEGAFVVATALLYSPDGADTPTLESLTISYDYFGPEPTPPNSCLVFGYILDEKEVPIAGATVTAINPSTYFNQGFVIAQGQRTAVTDSEGYFAFSLIETASLSGTNPVTFQVAYTQANVGTGFTPTTYIFGEADIPNTPSANFATLTFL